MTVRTRTSRRASPANRRLPIAVVATLLLVPALVRAHAVVYPDTAPPGAYQKYVLRVPTEREVATTRIGIRFPEAVRVVSFADVPGWELEVMTDAAGRIIGAVWTGTLPPHRFVELPFVAVNPDAEATITWPVTQTYEGGEVVEWAGPEGSDAPASVTRVTAGDEASSGFGWPAWAAGAALLLSILALGLALRPSKTPPAGA
ncbi:MAG: YcnI family protein [Gemmatimonadota bacterium]